MVAIGFFLCVVTLVLGLMVDCPQGSLLSFLLTVCGLLGLGLMILGITVFLWVALP